MADYSIKLPIFEGPLELLIHLLEKSKVDIYDIPIADITDQYMDYLTSMQAFDIEIASEFLVMATLLLHIKSKMLLPKNPLEQADSADEENRDPRDILVDKIVEYKKFQQAAVKLGDMLEERKKFTPRPESILPTKRSKLLQYSADNLLDSMLSILQSIKKEDPVNYIEIKEISIDGRMKELLEFLTTCKEPILFTELFANIDKECLVVSFLAVLELLKEGKIIVCQQDIFEPIYVSLKEV